MLAPHRGFAAHYVPCCAAITLKPAALKTAGRLLPCRAHGHLASAVGRPSPLTAGHIDGPQRLLEAAGALRALLAAHLPAFRSVPLLLHAALTGGRLSQSIVHLLAHRSTAELALHAALTEQVRDDDSSLPAVLPAAVALLGPWVVLPGR
jgi:hypothetical protein